MSAPVVDKALAYHERFDRRLRSELRALATDAVLEEHRMNPSGARGTQSEALRRLLNYFRRAPQAGKYVVVAVRSFEEYKIGVLSGVRGVAPTVLEAPAFASEADALHGVFEARVRDLRES